jgi:hypothetical protein
VKEEGVVIIDEKIRVKVPSDSTKREEAKDVRIRVGGKEIIHVSTEK